MQQEFPEGEATSAVLLQRYLIGLRLTISRQMLLRSKLKSFHQDITDATEVERAFSFCKGPGQRQMQVKLGCRQ